MPFDWMDTKVPESVVNHLVEQRHKVGIEEIRLKAGMLRRLGHPYEYALHRCMGNQAWGYEMRGVPPLTDDEVREVVSQAYGH